MALAAVFNYFLSDVRKVACEGKTEVYAEHHDADVQGEPDSPDDDGRPNRWVCDALGASRGGTSRSAPGPATSIEIRTTAMEMAA